MSTVQNDLFLSRIVFIKEIFFFYNFFPYRRVIRSTRLPVFFQSSIGMVQRM
jgi:hypothetical protein